MKHTFIGNAFSLQMLAKSTDGWDASIAPISIEEIQQIPELTSCVGHVDTASVLSSILERNIPANRASLTLNEGDELIVAQLSGGRLPEGCTTLPEGFTFTFFKVKVTPKPCKCGAMDPNDSGCQMCPVFGLPGCPFSE